MTSKERVYNTLSKKSVDRVPLYMWYHPGTKFHLANQSKEIFDLKN